MDRRTFSKYAVLGMGLVTVGNATGKSFQKKTRIMLGGPVFGDTSSPEKWIEAVKSAGYRAAYCPLKPEDDIQTIRAYEQAAEKAGIVIAETGAWSNPMNKNEEERKKAIEKCINELELADNIGARCCVNIVGSRGDVWDGHDPQNFTDETFEMIVETTRMIIDAVKPKRTFYTLESMPWMFPDTTDNYLRLYKAIDRKGFGVHFDPVNMINSPYKYYENGELIKEFFQKLGPHIKSCHAKDITMHQKLTLHLDEVVIGEGNLNYDVYLTELANLPNEIPLMLEHLNTQEEYVAAGNALKTQIKSMGLK